MKIKVELTEADLKKLILKHFKEYCNDDKIVTGDVIIEVKSAQNYKSEWKVANFRASIERTV